MPSRIVWFTTNIFISSKIQNSETKKTTDTKCYNLKKNKQKSPPRVVAVFGKKNKYFFGYFIFLINFNVFL